MTKQTFFKATAIVLTMLFSFSSCNKDEANKTSQDVTLQEVSAEDIEKTEITIENLLSSFTDSSVDDFVSQIRKLENIKKVEVENDLVYITTSAGELISVDLNGTTSQEPIMARERVDTCGMYIQSLLDKIEYEIVDSIAEGTEDNPIREDSIDNVNDGNEPIETRAVGVMNRTVLSKMKMAIWSPWEEFNKYVIPNFCQAVNNAKLGCKIITDFSPSSFSTFGNYDLVYIVCHGASDGALAIPQKYWNLYVDQFAKKKEDGRTVVDVDAAREAGIRIHYEKKENGIVKSVALERIFFEKHLSRLSNTIIWTSSCHVGSNRSAFLLGALTRGCPEFYGADNVCSASGPMSVFKQFLPLFAYGASTKLSFEKSIPYINKKGYSYNFVRHGNNNITYIKPHITGLKEKNSDYAIVGAHYDYSLDIVGATNRETPYQLGILLENLNEGNSQRIALNNSNIKSAMVDSWTGVIRSYFVDVLLGDLKPNTNYRYCTYVIVNNKPIYSEKRQTFKTKEIPLCPDNHHPHAIDLGVGVKFACCNVGASSPAQFGNYYEWKESESVVANWGGEWCMPSLSQLCLLKKCSHEWKNMNGTYGMLFEGKNGNRVFLPAAGIRLYDGVKDLGIKGHYWASEVAPGTDNGGGLKMLFDRNGIYEGYGNCYGYSLRPIAR